MDAYVVPRAFVRVAGPDAEAYLQGQLSQDVAAIDTGAAAASFLLEPNGKLVALLRVTRIEPEAFGLDADAEVGDAVGQRLRRFLLRTKADIDVLPTWNCSRVFGDPPPARARVAIWPGAPRPHDLLGETIDVPADVTWLTDDEYARRRIGAGVPVVGVDVGPDTMPAEMGQWAIDVAVSFTKGCYTGQELVARVDSRGAAPPRRLLRLVVDGRVTAPAGIVSAEGKALGTATSAVWDPEMGATAALGLVHRSAAPPADVLVDGMRAELRDLPT